MKKLLFFMFYMNFIFTQIQGIGISDLSMERAEFKAKIQFQKNLSLSWNNGIVSDSIYLLLSGFDENLISIKNTMDTLSVSPLAIEFRVMYSFDDISTSYKKDIQAIPQNNSTNYWIINGRIKDEFNFYYGIGKSSISRELANKEAYHNFGKNVEVKVKSLFEMEKVEQNDAISSYKRSVNEILTDVSLKGVNITETHVDTITKIPLNITYYTLIKYNKNEYNKIIIEERKREFDKKIALLKKEQARVNEEIRLKQIEEDKKQKQLEAEKAAEERKKQREKLFLSRYREFLDTRAPARFIQTYSADLSSRPIMIIPELNLDPTKLRSFQASFSIAEVEIYGKAYYFNKKSVRDPEIAAKLRILPHKGKFNITSLAIGYIFYYDGVISKFKDAAYDQSFSGYMNISFPEFLYSQAAVYVDKRQLEFGLISYPFFRNFGSSFGIVTELHFDFEEKYQNKFNDDAYFNFGLKFNASSRFSTTISYIENHKYLLQLEVGI